MKYNKIERCKFSKSRRHLIELMRAYGLKNMLVREEGEDVAMLVMARSYVIKDMERLKISLNVEETRRENWKAICDDLSPQEITVVFFRALAAVKEGYLEDFTPENKADQKTMLAIKTSLEQDQAYLSTFEEANDKNLTPFPFTPDGEGPGAEERRCEIENYRNMLIDLELDNIVTVASLNKLFWRLAAMGIEMNQSLRDAIISLTQNPEMRDYIDYTCDKYFETVTASKVFRHRQTYLSQNKELERTKAEVTRLHLALAEKNKELKEKNIELTDLGYRLKRDYYLKMSKTDGKRKAEKNICRKLFQNLTFRQSELPLAYDLNQESHMLHYLEWFELGKYRLSEGKIIRIIKNCITDEQAKNRFRELAQQMNESIVINQQSNDASMPIEEDYDEQG